MSDISLYKPFTVPISVCLKSIGLAPQSEPDAFVPLRVLDAQTLSEMCDAYRAAVFTKAQRTDPNIQKASA